MTKKTVLITGGAGFIGHAIIEHFLETTDLNIVSMDRLDTSGRLDRLGHILSKNPDWKKRLRVIWHDLKAPISKHSIDALGDVNYILHLAAGSHVDRSILYPLEFVMDNIVGTCNLLEYARQDCQNLELFLYFSTDEVFGPAPEGVVFDENSRYNASNPYAATKAGAEELCNAYCNTYGVPVVVTHTMNVYGPGQHEEKFIPLVIQKLLNNETVNIHTNRDGSEPTRRRYLYSKDVARAMEFLMFNCRPGEKYNICADKETNSLELAQKLAVIMNKELRYELSYPAETRPGNDFRYAVCGKKMKELGWRPTMDLNSGLKKTVGWYLKRGFCEE